VVNQDQILNWFLVSNHWLCTLYYRTKSVLVETGIVMVSGQHLANFSAVYVYMTNLLVEFDADLSMVGFF